VGCVHKRHSALLTLLPEQLERFVLVNQLIQVKDENARIANVLRNVHARLAIGKCSDFSRHEG
jgi:hypothetical protein